MLLCSVVLTAFYGSRKRVEAAVDDAFKQAIEQDYQNRKSYLTRNVVGSLYYDVRDYAAAPVIDRKIGSYTLRTRTGLFTYQFKDSISEESAKRLLNQHLLEKVHRLNPDYLKSLFRERLEAKGIKAEVGVLCLRDSVRHWSKSDSIVPKKAYSTPRQTLDITGKLKVQAWADYGWGTVVSHLDPVMYVFLLLLGGVLMWVLPKEKKRTEEQEAKEEPVSGIVIDDEKQELTIDGVPCVIAKLDLSLLRMLCERNGECLTREEIKRQFWRTDDNAGEKIDTHIKVIRKVLKDFPRYQVVTVRGKGYYLAISD